MSSEPVTEVALVRREAGWQALLQDEQLEDFGLLNHWGSVQYASELTEKGTKAFLWLAPGQEPTEHLLNELLEADRKHGWLKNCLYLIFPDREAENDPAAGRYLEGFPEEHLFEADFELLTEPLARSMYTDPEKLPLILVVRQGLRGIYAVSGYNIGTADMLIRMIKNEGGNI